MISQDLPSFSTNTFEDEKCWGLYPWHGML